MHKIIHGTDTTTLSFSYEATTSQPTSRILATSVARNPKLHKRLHQAIRKNSTMPQSNFHSSWGPTPEVPLKFQFWSDPQIFCAAAQTYFPDIPL
jgi:hypothetical protein